MRLTRLVVVLVLVGLVAFWFEPPTTLDAQAPISMDEYHAAVAQSLALVQEVQALPSAERAPQLKTAAVTLDAIRQVQTPSGATVSVDNTELVALIRNPNQTETAIARLAALEAALARPLPVIDPNNVTKLRDLLNRPPFVRETALPWWQELLMQIIAFFERLAGNTAQGVFEVRDLLILLAGLVVLGVLIYFIRNLRRNLVSEVSLPPALMEEQARTPGEAFDNAQRYINAGDYRSAVRQLYLATLLLLDQRGRIKYDPTLTNREYLRQTRNDAHTTAALVPIVETFDRTWYGFESISPQDFEEYRQRVEGIKSL